MASLAPMRSRASLKPSIAASFAFLIASATAAFGQACPTPKAMSFRVENQILRDVRGFTQGLEVRDDKLFESTGLIAGDTRLTTIDPKSGKVTVLSNFGKTFFGEGLTILKDRIYQLSWKEHQAFVYRSEEHTS